MKLQNLTVAGFLSFAVMVPIGVGATSGDERITNFAVTANLDKSNVLSIDEAIIYDFGSNSRHGIYRDIPTAYKDDKGNTYRLSVKFTGVAMDGAAIANTTEASSAMVEDKIGDPNRTISGVHIYRITYTISPIVTQSNGFDLLNLNITGNGWQVPIDNVTAAINTNGAVLTGQPQCFTGGAGSRSSRCSVANNNGIIRLAATQLATGDGLTLNAQIAAGSYSSYLTPYVAPPVRKLDLVLPVIALFLAMTVYLRWIVQAIAARRRRHEQTVVAQYESPDGLRPAELGLLIDDRADMVEITATLIDLAVRGYLTIEQTQQKTWLQKADYRFTRLSNDEPLESYESTLLTGLFGDSSQVMLSAVDRTGIAATVESVKASLGARLKDKGYYAVSPSSSSQAISLLLMMAVGVPGGVALITAIARNSLFAAIFGMVGIVASILVHWYLNNPRGMTAEGINQYAKVAGFKLYLGVAEKDRINFTDAPDKTPELFNKLLPAAVALGVEKAWAKQFEGMDLSQSSGWYVGNNGMGAYLLASSLGSDFNSSLSSSFAPVSSSGGSSGGGFGGGGGGSW